MATVQPSLFYNKGSWLLLRDGITPFIASNIAAVFSYASYVGIIFKILIKIKRIFLIINLIL